MFIEQEPVPQPAHCAGFPTPWFPGDSSPFLYARPTYLPALGFCCLGMVDTHPTWSDPRQDRNRLWAEQVFPGSAQGGTGSPCLPDNLPTQPHLPQCVPYLPTHPPTVLWRKSRAEQTLGRDLIQTPPHTQIVMPPMNCF